MFVLVEVLVSKLGPAFVALLLEAVDALPSGSLISRSRAVSWASWTATLTAGPTLAPSSFASSFAVCAALETAWPMF